MKVIIIEGTDRTGKDTIINELKNLANNVLIIHCSKPEGDSFYEQEKFQDLLFLKYKDNLCSNKYNIADIVIFNRAWYGEYVYGTLYRYRSKDDVAALIKGIEVQLKQRNIDLYYIQLINDSCDLALKNDDGNSISNKIENIKQEIELFKEVYELSTVNKILIKVNDGDEFRNKEDILNEVLDFING